MMNYIVCISYSDSDEMSCQRISVPGEEHAKAYLMSCIKNDRDAGLDSWLEGPLKPDGSEGVARKDDGTFIARAEFQGYTVRYVATPEMAPLIVDGEDFE